jgi:hypothetical protein
VLVLPTKWSLSGLSVAVQLACPAPHAVNPMRKHPSACGVRAWVR